MQTTHNILYTGFKFYDLIQNKYQVAHRNISFG